MTDSLNSGASISHYTILDSSGIKHVEGGVVSETMLAIFVNGQELTHLMCSPIDPVPLALGFLFGEGVIDSYEEVGHVQTNLIQSLVDVMLTRPDFTRPHREILASGCGGGVAFQILSESYPPVNSDLRVSPETLFARMRDLHAASDLYREVRGIHTAVLTDAHRMLLSAEDIGRHNAVDRIVGQAMLKGISTSGHILLTSGRVSSEMLSKARRMGVAIVASRTSPTSMSIRLAKAWNICLVGYMRHNSLRIYANPWRIKTAESSAKRDLL
ncbi:MAG: formate dehydrogenase accessory sulfurtransferase FdhD [Chloroflexi bacterium]|nr:formate dehydrogenase accessory sulfurtransferase FdhD [Chloroflexota bacterium]